VSRCYNFCDIIFLKILSTETNYCTCYYTKNKETSFYLFYINEKKKKLAITVSKKTKKVYSYISFQSCGTMASGYNNCIHISQEFLILQQDCHNGPWAK
jgi:hypothetical protein